MGATMSLAGRLKGRDDVYITLVNPQTRFTERLRLHEFAYTLNSAQDAATFAAQLDRLDGATVVVAGGGLTGIESAAKIAEQHPDVDVLLLSRDEPGSMMGAKARTRLHAGLARLGVRFRGDADIVKVMADGVALG